MLKINTAVSWLHAMGSWWFHSVSLKCFCFRAPVDPNEVQW